MVLTETYLIKKYGSVVSVSVHARGQLIISTDRSQHSCIVNIITTFSFFLKMKIKRNINSTDCDTSLEEL